jgi:hypothetical protein
MGLHQVNEGEDRPSVFTAVAGSQIPDDVSQRASGISFEVDAVVPKRYDEWVHSDPQE